MSEQAVDTKLATMPGPKPPKVAQRPIHGIYRITNGLSPIEISRFCRTSMDSIGNTKANAYSILRRTGFHSSDLNNERSSDQRFSNFFTLNQVDGELLITHASLRMCGNRITSRMEGESVRNITKRSMPMPSPAVGGSPYSKARI